jgi:glycosyltransferase involved in cell wall biosynthesis
MRRWVTAARLTIPDRFKSLYRYPWAVHALLRPRSAVPLLAARAPRIPAVPEIDLGAYDLVWVFKMEAALAFRDLLTATRAAIVIDLDDLDYVDRAVRPPGRAGLGGNLHRVPRGIDARIDALDRRARVHWREELAQLADAVALANPAETGALASARVEIVRNGFDVPPAQGVRAPRAEQPVLLFVGSMGYFPNRDGARFLVDEVLPHLRHRVGDCQVRIVGSAPPDVLALHDPPAVVVTGFVDDLSAELAGADLAVVPLRHGSGTRLKILEAFAHEIPVVSTAIGAEGLGAGNGVHLLIADDPEAFAQACHRLLGEASLRRALTEAAYQLVADHYAWPVVAQHIAAFADSIVAEHGAPDARGPAQ